MAVRNQDLGGKVGCFSSNFPSYYFADNTKEFSLDFFLTNCQGKDLLRTSQLRHEDCDRPWSSNDRLDLEFPFDFFNLKIPCSFIYLYLPESLLLKTGLQCLPL